MYHARSNLPCSRYTNEIYAQARSGRAKRATLLVIIYYNKHECVCVYIRVRALREVTGSDSTSRQMLLSLGGGDCRPKRGCPVSWHP